MCIGEEMGKWCFRARPVELPNKKVCFALNKSEYDIFIKNS
jgi:hypothetical protein